MRFPNLIVCLLVLSSAVGSVAAEIKPLRVLLIAGGCCHDYGKQKDVLKSGIEERAYAKVDLAHTNDSSTKARFEVYADPNWAKGYDVVIRDECSSDVKEMSYVQNILAAHKNIPAVNLHCAMHSYRTGTPDWFKFVGIQSSSHGPQEPIALRFLEAKHPITSGLSDWTTIKEELYNNVKIFDTAVPLIRGTQMVKQKDGTEKAVESVVAWANQYENTRVFSTTLGHNTQTVGDARYLDLITRGLLWSCGKMDRGYLKPSLEK